MKKVLIILMLLVIPFTSFSQVAFGEAAEKITYETDCPTGYTGSSKCVVYEFDKYKEKKILSEGTKIENTDTNRETSTGKKLSKQPVLWVLGSALGYMASKNDSVANGLDVFWSNAEAVDRTVNVMADNFLISTVDELNDKFDLLKDSEEPFVNWSSEALNDFWKAASEALNDEYDFFDPYMNDKWKHAFENDVMALNAMAHVESIFAGNDTYFNLSLIKAGYSQDSKKFYLLYQYQRSTQFRGQIFTFAVSDNGTSYSSTSSESASSLEALINTEAYKTWINHPDYWHGKTFDQETIDNNTPLGHGELLNPRVISVATPKIIELPDGQKFYEVESPYPGMPDLYPLDNPSVPEPTRTIIEADTGKEINKDGLTIGEPITPPITNPLPNPISPASPSGPGDGPINPSAPDKPNKPTKPPPIQNGNPLPLILIFLEFLLACIMYVIRLGDFILSIPDVPKRQFPGTVGVYFNYFQHVKFGNIYPYYVFLGLVNLLFGLMVYKVLRRVFNG